MADELLIDVRVRRGRRALPIAVRIALLYVGARVVTTLFLWAAAAMSGPTSRFGDHATVGSLMLGWDAQWYWFAAVNGYPSTLPVSGGQVAENQWAFLPVYAYVSQWLGFGSWGVGAVVVSLVAGYLCCVVLYRMMRSRLDASAAMWSVVFFACGPLAALFQLGYAEALFLLWLFLALWAVLRRRYLWLYALIPLMAFTRPGVLAFALFLGLYGVWRLLGRARERLGIAEALHIVALGALGAVTGFLWQWIAGWVTGVPDAYLATELAWRRNWIANASSDFSPFHGFLQGVAFWFESWGLGATTGYVVLVVVLAAIAALLLFEPHVRRLGVELRLWTASYLVYLLAVFFPQSSIFRILLPVSPMWGAPAVPRSTVWRVGILVAGVAGQWWWIYNMYALGNTYWQIP